MVSIQKTIILFVGTEAPFTCWVSHAEYLCSAGSFLSRWQPLNCNCSIGSLPFVKSEDSLPHFHEPTCCLHSQPHHQVYFFNIHRAAGIIHSFAPKCASVLSFAPKCASVLNPSGNNLANLRYGPSIAVTVGVSYHSFILTEVALKLSCPWPGNINHIGLASQTSQVLTQHPRTACRFVA